MLCEESPSVTESCARSSALILQAQRLNLK
jgi:hypothetical protein